MYQGVWDRELGGWRGEGEVGGWVGVGVGGNMSKLCAVSCGLVDESESECVWYS